MRVWSPLSSSLSSLTPTSLAVVKPQNEHVEPGSRKGVRCRRRRLKEEEREKTRNRAVGKRDEPDSRAWVARKDQVGIAVNTHAIVRMEVAAKAGSTMDERAFSEAGSVSS